MLKILKHPPPSHNHVAKTPPLPKKKLTSASEERSQRINQFTSSLQTNQSLSKSLLPTESNDFKLVVNSAFLVATIHSK